MKKHYRSIALTVVLTTSIPVSAATDFTNADSENSLISNALNWDNGLPVGQQGTISINATVDTGVNLSAYDILHTDGTIGQTGISAVQLTDGASWVTNGATATTTTGFRGFDVRSGSSFTMQNGTINTASGRDWAVVDNGSSMTVNGGVINLGRHLLLSGTSGPTFTINGGSITSTTGDIGGRHFADNSKTLNFNGGATSALNLDLQGNNTFFVFGGFTTGSLTAGNLLAANVVSGFGTNSSMNWLPGTQMTLTLTGVDEFAETYWDSGKLLFNGQAKTDLGELTWADASNSSIGLGGGYYWSYDSGTETLSLASGAPPVSNPFQITAFSAVTGEPGVWQVSLTGDASADYVFRSSTILDFSSGSLVENLTPGVPAAGTIGGTNDSVVTTNGSGEATVRMTLAGDPADFIRAETAP